MRETIQKAKKKVEQNSEYLPIVALCVVLLLTPVASSVILSQPLNNAQYSTVSGQDSPTEKYFGAGARTNDNRGYYLALNDDGSLSYETTISNAQMRGATYASNGTWISADFDGFWVFGPGGSRSSYGTFLFDDTPDNINLDTSFDGRVYATDGVKTIQAFDISDNSITAIRNPDSRAFSVADSLVMMDNNGLITEYDLSGDEIGDIGTVPGSPIDLDYDSERIAYLTSDEIGIIDKNGNEITSNVSVSINGLTDLVLTNDGYVYAGPDGIIEYDSDGNVVTSISSTGYVDQPTSITVTSTEFVVGDGGGLGQNDGRLLVYDRSTGALKYSHTGRNVRGTASADDISLTPPPEIDPRLEIETRNYLPHGKSAPYEVYYTNPQTENVNEVTDRSGLSVSSSNTSVFSIDENASVITATENTDINKQERFTATYEGVTTTENVTVANSTVDNLKILPGVTRVDATYTDSNIVLVLVGTILAVVATRYASAFAGIGVLQLTLVSGFFVDLVSLGLVLVGLFASLFIGLNLAANIDYTVRR